MQMVIVMEQKILPSTDKNGIIQALPIELSKENVQRLKKFSSFMIFYDFVQNHFVRPRIHKADPQRHRQILEKLISSVKNARVLDIACGTGGAIPLFDDSIEYTGLDLSYAMLKQAIKKAKKKSFRKSRFIHGNAEKLVFEKESFDFVLMDTALHMIPKYRKTVAETARILTRGGVFVCSTPVVGINYDFDVGWKKISGKRNLHSFSEEEVKRVCLFNGLIYRHIDINGGVLYFQGQKPK